MLLQRIRRLLTRRSVQFLLIAIIVISLVSAGVADMLTANPSPNSSKSRQLNTGIIIPMFPGNYSQAQVSEVIQEKQTNPQVPFIVVVNFQNGPGSSYSSQIASGIKSMQDAGISVLGYDPTNWGERGIPSVEQDMLTFHNWYHVNGIYLDQMPNWEFNSYGTYLGLYFANLTSYAHSLGMAQVLGNSGADVPYYFVGTVDQIGIFENSYLPSLANLSGWHLSYNKTNFWFVSYNQPAPNPYYIAATSDYVGYLYLTNGLEPYPYSSLPPYFDSLVSDLNSLVPITINTKSLGNAIIPSGFNVTVTQPDGYSDSMYTPATFNVVRGSNVTISAQDHAGFVFDHWSTGSNSSTISLVANQATNLTAYSTTSQRTTSLVAVTANSTSNVPVLGLSTTATLPNGTVVASGYTPFSFQANKSTTYTISIQNYQNITFAYWGNSTNSINSNNSIAVTPEDNVHLQAIVVDSRPTNASFDPGGYSLDDAYVTNSGDYTTAHSEQP